MKKQNGCISWRRGPKSDFIHEGVIKSLDTANSGGMKRKFYTNYQFARLYVMVKKMVDISTGHLDLSGPLGLFRPACESTLEALLSEVYGSLQPPGEGRPTRQAPILTNTFDVGRS
jgi:hypothetical protein